MELTGRIKLISPIKQVSSDFKTREIVLVTDEAYPQYISFQFHNDRCGLLDVFTIDETAKISFNLKGKEWVNPQGETKYFNTLQGWRIEKVTTEAIQPPAQPEPLQAFPLAEGDINDEEFDDLPF